MFCKKLFIEKFTFKLTILLCLVFASNSFVFPQNNSIQEQRQQATELVNQNRYIDALPILEKIMLSYPNDAELWAHFGIAIMTNASAITDAETRKTEQERGVKALTRAKELGTTNTRALHYLDEFRDGDVEDNFSNENPEVEKALREGEAFFGRGEYEEAFKAYERAHKIDPNNYEAVLFMGDCFYAQKKYKEAEPYFAKAVKINPNIEMAYRFWGDALLYQDKYDESLEKFLDALILEPFSRMSWDSLRRWAVRSESNFSLVRIIPPGSEIVGSVKINENLLNEENGTAHWKLYSKTASEQSAEKAGLNQRYSLSDEIQAWRNVAQAVRKGIKDGNIKYPDQSLVNLIKLDDKGLLEPYILLLRPQPTFGEDYADYSEKNREKLRQFVKEFILNLKT